MAAVAVAASAPVLAVASAPSQKLSTQLVGNWTRKVSESDVTRGKPLIPASILANATCRLAIKSTGAAHLDCGRLVGSLNGQLVPVGGTNVRIVLGDGMPNSYHWAVTGGHLTLTNVSDTSHDRMTIFRGVWSHG